MGGGAEVQKVLAAKGLRDVEVGVEERLLQPRISGLEWRTEYIDGDLFNRARDRVPDAERDAALARYLQNPPDGATPIGTVNALEALAEGRLLSPESTERLLFIMSEGRAGGARLKAGTPVDWRLSHKTGTGPDWRRVTAGYNDVGVMMAPNGQAYAVAVYIGRTEAPVRERQALMAAVARAVVEHWHAGQPAGTPVPVMPVRPTRGAPPPPAAPPLEAETTVAAAAPATAAGSAAPQPPAGSSAPAP
jgi:beta-lactamase class A